MAKIHTHYDNLKVSRQAPQEVIRASYKALCQKYHPDKNPGDEKAARIMAIVNTAYSILSDPVRRKEHDEWIAAEEWEVEWLESSNGKDGQPRRHGDADHAGPRRAPLVRDPRWWLGLAACFVAGAACSAALLLLEPPLVPGAQAQAEVTATTLPSAAMPAPTLADELVPVRAPATIRFPVATQVVLPASCEQQAHPALPPGGWPSESGYLPGSPRGNPGADMQVLVDNRENASPVLVTLLDRERQAEVRQAYVLPYASFMIDKLSAGNYEVRYQNTDAPRLPGCAEVAAAAAAPEEPEQMPLAPAAAL